MDEYNYTENSRYIRNTKLINNIVKQLGTKNTK